MSRVNIKERLNTNNRINMNHFDNYDELELYKVFDNDYYPPREKILLRKRRKNIYFASSILCTVGGVVYCRDIEEEKHDISNISANEVIIVQNNNNVENTIIAKEAPVLELEDSKLQEAIEVAKASLERSTKDNVVDLKEVAQENVNKNLNMRNIKTENEDYYLYNLEAKLENSLKTTQDSYEIEIISSDSVEKIESKAIDNAMRYWSYFEYYGYTYGVDPYLLVAIASQESFGEHYSTIPGGDNFDGLKHGIMKIEQPGKIIKEITAYNHTTQSYDIMHINSEDDVKAVPSNIRAGAMLIAQIANESQYNPYVSIQSYNYGTLGVKYALSYYMADGNIDNIQYIFKDGNGEDLLSYISSNELKWLNTKTSSGLTAREWYSSEGFEKIKSTKGDKDYFENVIRYYHGEESPYIVKNTGTKIYF